MENPRQEKVAVVTEIAAKLQSADAAFITEYRGLSVGALAQLARSRCVSQAPSTRCTRTRWPASPPATPASTVSRSCSSARPASRSSAATSPPPPRRCATLAKANPLLVIKGGSLGKARCCPRKDVEALADLPSREVLLAQFAGALQAPLVKTAGLLQALPRNFAYGLKALIDQKEAA